MPRTSSPRGSFPSSLHQRDETSHSSPYTSGEPESGEGAFAIEARIRVRLTPRAAGERLAGWRGETLLARVSAPPVDGKANEALERLLATALGVAPRDVRVVSGAAGREKTVAVAGLSREQALARLREVAPS